MGGRIGPLQSEFFLFLLKKKAELLPSLPQSLGQLGLGLHRGRGSGSGCGSGRAGGWGGRRKVIVSRNVRTQRSARHRLCPHPHPRVVGAGDGDGDGCARSCGAVERSESGRGGRGRVTVHRRHRRRGTIRIPIARTVRDRGQLLPAALSLSVSLSLSVCVCVCVCVCVTVSPARALFSLLLGGRGGRGHGRPTVVTRQCIRAVLLRTARSVLRLHRRAQSLGDVYTPPQTDKRETKAKAKTSEFRSHLSSDII